MRFLDLPLKLLNKNTESREIKRYNLQLTFLLKTKKQKKLFIYKILALSFNEVRRKSDKEILSIDFSEPWNNFSK